MKVLVGSQNPVKIEAVKDAFSKYFGDVEVIGMKVPSNVPDQPFGEDTYKGAKNRALALKKLSEEQDIDADFFVGVEGGVIKLYGTWLQFGGMCIIDKKGRTSFGASPHYPLPDCVVEQLMKGIELGTVMDNLSKEHNTKQKGESIAYFTKNVMARKEFYMHGLVVALVPFLNEELYFKKK